MTAVASGTALQSHLTGIEISWQLLWAVLQIDLQSHLTGIEIFQKLDVYKRFYQPSIAPYWN